MILPGCPQIKHAYNFHVLPNSFWASTFSRATECWDFIRQEAEYVLSPQPSNPFLFPNVSWELSGSLASVENTGRLLSSKRNESSKGRKENRQSWGESSVSSPGVLGCPSLIWVGEAPYVLLSKEVAASCGGHSKLCIWSPEQKSMGTSCLWLLVMKNVAAVTGCSKPHFHWRSVQPDSVWSMLVLTRIAERVKDWN